MKTRHVLFVLLALGAIAIAATVPSSVAAMAASQSALCGMISPPSTDTR